MNTFLDVYYIPKLNKLYLDYIYWIVINRNFKNYNIFNRIRFIKPIEKFFPRQLNRVLNSGLIDIVERSYENDYITCLPDYKGRPY